MKFFDCIDKNKNENIKIFCDMDGVIAEYDIGNFDYNTIRPIMSIINKLEMLNSANNIDVYILSICKTNDVLKDKIKWLKKYVSFLDKNHIILLSKEDEDYNGVPSKMIKSNFLKQNCISENINIVIDDDNSIIKFLKENNENIIIFQDSSLVD